MIDDKELDSILAEIPGDGWDELPAPEAPPKPVGKKASVTPISRPKRLPEKLPQIGNYGELGPEAKIPEGRPVEIYKGQPDRVATTRPRRDQGMKAFSDIIQHDGGAFIEACKMQPRESKWFSLALMIVHPSWRQYSLAAKCRRLSISLREIKEFYLDAQKQFGEVVMYSRLPGILEAAADAASARQIACMRCNGSGLEPVMPVKNEADEELQPSACKDCEGTGRITLPADPVAREAVLQMAGLIKNSKGFQVNNTVNLGNSSTEDTSSEIGRILNVTPE